MWSERTKSGLGNEASGHTSALLNAQARAFWLSRFPSRTRILHAPNRRRASPRPMHTGAHESFLCARGGFRGPRSGHRRKDSRRRDTARWEPHEPSGTHRTISEIQVRGEQMMTKQPSLRKNGSRPNNAVLLGKLVRHLIPGYPSTCGCPFHSSRARSVSGPTDSQSLSAPWRSSGRRDRPTGRLVRIVGPTHAPYPSAACWLSGASSCSAHRARQSGSIRFRA